MGWRSYPRCQQARSCPCCHPGQSWRRLCRRCQQARSCLCCHRGQLWMRLYFRQGEKTSLCRHCWRVRSCPRCHPGRLWMRSLHRQGEKTCLCHRRRPEWRCLHRHRQERRCQHRCPYLLRRHRHWRRLCRPLRLRPGWPRRQGCQPVRRPSVARRRQSHRQCGHPRLRPLCWFALPLRPNHSPPRPGDIPAQERRPGLQCEPASWCSGLSCRAPVSDLG